MGDARNEYPRHCRYCWAVITTWEDDHANYNYGGVCASCAASPDAKQELAVRDYTDFNNVYDGDEENIRGKENAQYDTRAATSHS